MNPSADKDRPSLSVIIVALDGGSNLARCLHALASQQNPPRLEILVAHDDRLADPAGLRTRFPGVTFIPCAARLNFPAIRAAGMCRANSDLIAATEDQCIPPPLWCANIVAAHSAIPAGAIGGPVEKVEPDTLLNWAVYLREFGEYMPPLPEGPRNNLTDCNVTYKRAALAAVTPLWESEFHEPLVHAALRHAGQQLWLSPSLVTSQQRSFTFSCAVAERYRFGRLYGALRANAIGSVRRWLLILASLLIPLLLLVRVFLWVLRRPRRLGIFLAASPFLVLFSVAWCWGEFLGYLSRQPAKAV